LHKNKKSLKPITKSFGFSFHVFTPPHTLFLLLFLSIILFSFLFLYVWAFQTIQIEQVQNKSKKNHNIHVHALQQHTLCLHIKSQTTPSQNFHTNTLFPNAPTTNNSKTFITHNIQPHFQTHKKKNTTNVDLGKDQTRQQLKQLGVEKKNPPPPINYSKVTQP
jgi:cytoskeletal protein RodZ